VKYLALDVGSRRTGVAYGESSMGIAHPLETIKHYSLEELATRVRTLIEDRSVEHLVIGLPRLPSGDEGEQAEFVRSLLPLLDGFPYTLIDERHTTPKGQEGDGDSHAACQILTVKLDLE